VPRANEANLAVSNGNWSNDPGALEDVARIRRIVNEVAWSAPPRAPPPVPVRQMPVPEPSPTSSLNRGILKRSQRAMQVVSTKEVNLSSFNPSDEPVDELVKQQQAAPVPEAKPDVNVVVTPFAGVRVGDNLVLYRTVRTGDEEPRQGLVLNVPALAAHLEELVVSGSELRPHLALTWNGAASAPRRYSFDHRFAEPFGSMSVVAELDRIPDLVGRDAVTVPLLAAVVVLAVLGGGMGLYGAVRSELAYARRRNDFVAAVSHELKTPLTTIRMYAEMLRDGMVPGADRQRTYHHTITMESERLGRLIANVLELARLERGGPAPEVVVGSVAPVLRDAVEIVRPHAASAGFEVAVVADDDLPAVRIDRDALTQIVVNLVDNAVKFAAAGDKRIELTLHRNDDAGVELVVRDYGPGVPRAHLRRVFEPFWRGERELTRKTRGTGIGLALVRGLAERMGASVLARNHPSGGFEVVLQFAD
jgi:signal transduction histidine kinase